MTEVITTNTPPDYFDVFNTNLFTGNQSRELNWLEKSDRNPHPENLFQPKESDENCSL